MITDGIKRMILVDAGALNHAAFDIAVNFERMLNRPLPAMDVAKWLHAAACDGRFAVNNEEIRALFLREKRHGDFRSLNFANAPTGNNGFDYAGMHYRLEIEDCEGGVGHAFVETLNKLLDEDKELETMVCLPGEDIAQYVGGILGRAPGVRSTLLAMDNVHGGGFAQEYLSSSISYALGVTDGEIRKHGTPKQFEI